MFAMTTLLALSIVAAALATPTMAQDCGRGPYNWFGISAASLGVIDGKPNFVVGAPSAGLVHQFAGLTSRAPIRTLYGGHWFGIEVSATGDLDGDGAGDFAVASYDNFVHVYSGRTGAELFSVHVAEHQQGVDASEDVDGDGVRDLIVREWNGELYDNPDTRMCYAVISGRTHERIRFRVLDLPTFAYQVRAAGDVDHDGHGDVLVVTDPFRIADRRLREAFVDVYSGDDERLLHRVPVLVEAEYPHIAVCSLGDITGDGCADFAIGATDDDSGDPPPHNRPGRVLIVCGRTGEVLRTIQHTNEWDLFGYSLANAGDVDGDGVSDLIIGADTRFFCGLRRCSVFLASGRDGKLLREYGGRDIEPLGVFVASAGDVDGDGVPDQMLGSVLDATGAFYDGTLQLISGKRGQGLVTWGEPGAW